MEFQIRHLEMKVAKTREVPALSMEDNSRCIALTIIYIRSPDSITDTQFFQTVTERKDHIIQSLVRRRSLTVRNIDRLEWNQVAGVVLMLSWVLT
jgi:hypothetical protein